jgi:crotonobetainyl-CoA:carnitine CoA-transferase CaiB-like acyl-CoA transferase
MLQPMHGVRVLEVAQFTFVPAAGAVLADWGAEVIKVEHAERGDGQRGLTTVLGVDAIMKGSSFSPIFEGPNRGKRSVGLSLEIPGAREVLDELIKRSDVFLTNFLPEARQAAHQRRGHPEGQPRHHLRPRLWLRRARSRGEQGRLRHDRLLGRGGSGAGATPGGAHRQSPMPAGGYGDNIGGMTIASGIAAALFARATTGETSVIDVSLIGVGAWATQFTVNLALQAGGLPPRPPVPRHGSARNPLIGPYRTSGDRWILFSMLQPGRYWPESCTVSGHPEVAADERFDTVEKLMANAPGAGELVAGIIAEKTFEEWLEILATIEGQRAIVQDSWGVANDVSLRANGMIASLDDVDGIRRELVTNPVQFDETPIRLPTRRGGRKPAYVREAGVAFDRGEACL